MVLNISHQFQEIKLIINQLNEIEVLNSGENYDVVNPPTLSVTDTSGSGCDAYGNFSGNISEQLNGRGFDYTKTPSVTISGGKDWCSLRSKNERIYSKSFTDFDFKSSSRYI